MIFSTTFNLFVTCLEKKKIESLVSYIIPVKMLVFKEATFLCFEEKLALIVYKLKRCKDKNSKMYCCPPQAITYINDENVTDFIFTWTTTKTSILCGNISAKVLHIRSTPE